MLAELKSLMDADRRWEDNDPDTLQTFAEIRYFLDEFLDNGTKVDKGLIKNLFFIGEAGKTKREIQVKVDGEKFHLVITSSLEHRESDIHIALSSDDRSRASFDVAIPTQRDYVDGYLVNNGYELIKDLDLIKKDILPLVKKQVERDWKKGKPSTTK